MNETILEDAHEKRKRRKTALPFGQRSYFLLALIGSVDAECVIPEHPIVSIRASSITPFLTFKDSLQAPC